MSYCTPTDVTKYTVPATALATVSSTEQQAACDAASAEMDDHLGGRYPTPILAPYPLSLVINTAYMARYHMLSKRGFQSLQGADKMIETDYKKAIEWVMAVQRQSIHPNFNVTPSASPTFNLPQVYTAQTRGW